MSQKKPRVLVGFFNQDGGFTKVSVNGDLMIDVVIEKYAYDTLVVGLQNLHKTLMLAPDDGIRPIETAERISALLKEVGEKT